MRILDWSDLDFSPQLHQLEGLLRDLPNPRILRYGHSIIPRSSHFSLTTLTVRSLVPRGDHLGERELPETCTSLRELVEDGLHYHKLLQDFIIRRGAYLTTVKSHCIAEDLALLHKSCSDLGHLILSLDHLASYDPRLPVKRTFPCVSLLEIAYWEFLRFLAYPKNHLSMLAVFQLMNSYTVGQFLDDTHSPGVSTQIIAEKLSENCFRVEDDRGNLLSNGCRVSSPALLHHLYTQDLSASDHRACWSRENNGEVTDIGQTAV